MNRVLLAAVAVGLGGCGASESSTYTLYRNSIAIPGGEMKRFHVATFDTSDGHDYNMENCEQARSLFQSQSGVRTRFWCEKGQYRR